jgi:thymidine phosphorylase
MRVPPVSRQRQPILAERPGQVGAIDNRRIARLAKRAGAPDDKAAGVDLHVRVGDLITAGQPLCTVHAEAPGQLAYALDYAAANRDIIAISQP